MQVARVLFYKIKILREVNDPAPLHSCKRALEDSDMNERERDRIRGRLGVPCEITHLRKRVDTRATYEEHRSKGGVFLLL